MKDITIHPFDVFMSYQVKFMAGIHMTPDEQLEYYECLVLLAIQDPEGYIDDAKQAIQWYKDLYDNDWGEYGDLCLKISLVKSFEYDNGLVNVHFLRRHMQALASFLTLYEDYQDPTSQEVQSLFNQLYATDISPEQIS